MLNTKIEQVINKMPHVRGLVTNAALNIKIGDVENKNIDHAKYITATQFNKFSGEIFDEKLKQTKLATKKFLILLYQRNWKKTINF